MQFQQVIITNTRYHQTVGNDAVFLLQHFLWPEGKHGTHPHTAHLLAFMSVCSTPSLIWNKPPVRTVTPLYGLDICGLIFGVNCTCTWTHRFVTDNSFISHHITSYRHLKDLQLCSSHFWFLHWPCFFILVFIFPCRAKYWTMIFSILPRG